MLMPSERDDLEKRLVVLRERARARPAAVSNKERR